MLLVWRWDFVGNIPQMNYITCNNQGCVYFMAKENESADYSHHFANIYEKKKHIYAEVSKNRGIVYALVMNTLKLCVRHTLTKKKQKKNRCSPSAM